MYTNVLSLLKHNHYESLRCLKSRDIGGHSLNLHSLHIRKNKNAGAYIHRHPYTNVPNIGDINTP